MSVFPIPGNPDGNKKAEKKTPDDKVRLLSPCRDPSPLPNPGLTQLMPQQKLTLTPWVPISLNLPSPPPHTHGRVHARVQQNPLSSGTWKRVVMQCVWRMPLPWTPAPQCGTEEPRDSSPPFIPSTSSLASSSLITLWLSIGSKPWRRMIWISRERPYWDGAVPGVERGEPSSYGKGKRGTQGLEPVGAGPGPDR